MLHSVCKRHPTVRKQHKTLLSSPFYFDGEQLDWHLALMHQEKHTQVKNKEEPLGMMKIQKPEGRKQNHRSGNRELNKPIETTKPLRLEFTKQI